VKGGPPFHRVKTFIQLGARKVVALGSKAWDTASVIPYSECIFGTHLKPAFLVCHAVPADQFFFRPFILSVSIITVFFRFKFVFFHISNKAKETPTVYFYGATIHLISITSFWQTFKYHSKLKPTIRVVAFMIRSWHNKLRRTIPFQR